MGLKFTSKSGGKNHSGITALHQMLRKLKLGASKSNSNLPRDVPKGHVAVHVGRCFRRYIVRASQINHPAFRDLLDRVEDEYGFGLGGPLSIPNCSEYEFEQILRSISSKSLYFVSSEKSRTSSCCSRCRLFIRRALYNTESLPLLL